LPPSLLARPLDALSGDDDRPDGPFRTGALISILTGLSPVKLRHSSDRRQRPHPRTLDHASPQSPLFDAPRGQGGRHACSSWRPQQLWRYRIDRLRRPVPRARVTGVLLLEHPDLYLWRLGACSLLSCVPTTVTSPR